MVQNEIKKAMDLYQRLGRDLLQDSELILRLDRYRDAIENTFDTMRRMGVAKACALCGETSAGGCCFKGVEQWYDPLLLLINRLLGVRLPAIREIPNGCLFLGKTGCKLRARYCFCINYLCPEIKYMLDTASRKALMVSAGKEILCGIETEALIRSRIESSLCVKQSDS